MKNTIISHNFTGESLVLVYRDAKGKVQSKIADKTHSNWVALEKAYRKREYAKVVDLIDIPTTINKSFNGKIVVRDGKVWRGNEELSGYLFDKIFFFMRESLPFSHLLKFADNLWANPSVKARNDLYKFLETGHMPITEDGKFVAYKGVQNDFYSITAGNLRLLSGKVDSTGRVYNGIGEVIKCERRAVDDNADQTCSYGLHAGSYKYAKDFKGSGRLMLLLVNPKDVVIVPNEAGANKIRCCEYEVIAEETSDTPLDEAVDGGDISKNVRYHNRRNAKGQFAA